MAKNINIEKIAGELLEALGGEKNIKALEHCATRLRAVVKDDGLVDIETIKKTQKVGGYFYQSGQHQIILGTGLVNKVFDEINSGKEIAKGNIKEAAYSNLNTFQKGLRALADVFIPLIPVLVATGLCMGLRGFVMQLGVELSPELMTMTQVVTDTVFIFLPALVVWSAFKRFGGTPVVGMVLGLMLVAPMLPNAWGVASGSAEALEIGMFKIQGFQGTILPALIVGIFGASLEKWIKSWMPSVVDLIFTPFLTITIGMLGGLFILGPAFAIVEHGVMASGAGVFAIMMHVAPSVMGVTFIPAIPAYLGNGLVMYLAMIIIGMTTGGVFTRILVKK